MKSYFKKIFILYFILFLFFTSACSLEFTQKIIIKNGTEIVINVNEEIELEVETSLTGRKIFSTDNDCVYVSANGVLKGIKEGNALVTITINNHKKNVKVICKKAQMESIYIFSSKNNYYTGDLIFIDSEVKPESRKNDITFEVVDGNANINGNILTPRGFGTIKVEAYIDNIRSNVLTLEVIPYFSKEVKIKASKYNIVVEETIELLNDSLELMDITFNFTDSKYQEFAIINGNKLKALKAGKVVVVGYSGDNRSNEIEITIVNDTVIADGLVINSIKDVLTIFEETFIEYDLNPADATKNVNYRILSGSDVVELIGSKVKALKAGTCMIQGYIGDIKSNVITITVIDTSIDPYTNISKVEFYKNYKEAVNIYDSYYRTKHCLMSGDINVSDQKPIELDFYPKVGDTFIRNTSSYYNQNKDSYDLVDSHGKVKKTIFKGGAYITLDDVACYVFAFNDIPANYTTSKSTSPKNNEWKEYLRLNHSKFIGSQSSYPYQPVLPNIYGCGGNFYYYEMDLGTTGNDCNPQYKSVIYNDGNKITRGASRIVYSRYDINNNEILDINKKYLFYTYNHYNDFQEYLNYYGGWGQMFGNITGGGKLSSKTNYNPTSYVEVERRQFN